MCRGESINNNSDDFNLNSLSDNELISIVHADGISKESRDAVTVIISRYLSLVWKKAHSFSGNYADTEDLSQEGLMALLKAVSSFDVGNGAKFSSYADVCIGNRLKSAVSKQSLTPFAPLLDEDNNVLDDASPENIFVEKEFTENLYREISSLLSEKEWSIFRLYLENLSYSEIAGRLSITEKAVDNAVFRVRRKLKTLLSPGHFHR